MNAIYHETTNSTEHKNEQTAINRGGTAESIWDLKNYGNVNTNTMNGNEWLHQNADSIVLSEGNNNLMHGVTDRFGNADLSTWGYLAPSETLNYDTWSFSTPPDGDKTFGKKGKLIIIGAAKDGDTGIYIVPRDMIGDAYFNATPETISKIKKEDNLVGHSFFDSTFIMYNTQGQYVGPAVVNTINLNYDITEDYNNRVEAASKMNIFELQANSKTGQYFDVKNQWPVILNPALHGQEVKLKDGSKAVLYTNNHYDGYLLDGKYISGKGAGNVMFGENLENSIIPNTIGIDRAGVYQQQSNVGADKAVETNEAREYIEYGIDKARNK